MMSKFIGFLKNWTLPVSMAVGTVLYFLFYFVDSLEASAQVFDRIFMEAVPVLMFLVLFTNFCRADYSKLRPCRWHFVIGGLQLLFIAVVLGAILMVRPVGDRLTLMEATLCCVICPCAAGAPVITAKLGGNLERTTTYVFLSNFLMALLIPAAFPLVDPAVHMDFLTSFLRILSRVFMVLVVPMLLAYVVKHHVQWLHRRIVGIKDISFYLWATCLSIVTGMTVKHIVHASAPAVWLLLIAASALLCCVLQFSLGRRVGHRMGPVVECGQALGQKNTAFAIWIATSYLNPLSSVGPGCYILWQNIVNSLQLYRQRTA